MASKDRVTELSFDIDSSIVFQLGENLITDSVQAISELVKNSYDADASNCLLDIVTNVAAGEVSSRYSNAQGYISIEDDGHGMTAEELERGFLVISTSLKREMKKHSLKTKKGRTPLGDKGLGRLSAQRLADNVEIFTKPANSKFQYYIAFSWSDFRNHDRLSQVKVRYEERPSDGHVGTKLILSGLKNIDDWTGVARKNLSSSLARMISPYREIEDFNLLATIDGENLPLTELADQLRNAAQLRYFIHFDGKQIHFAGKAKLDYLFPTSVEDKKYWKAYVDNDGGQALFKFLSKDKNASRLNLTKPDDDNWFVQYSKTESFEMVPELRLIGKKAANPGPFRGEIDSFDFSETVAAKVINQFDIFNKTSDYRKAIESMSGVRIYRDGFGVRVDQDWLGLGKQWTFASSYYTLKPANTIGFIAITAENNSQLEETTDREGFKNTAFLENFMKLMERFVLFSADGQEYIRRGWLKFREDIKREEINADEDDDVEHITARAKSKVAKATALKSDLAKTKASLTSGSKASVKKAAQDAVTKVETYVKEVANISLDLDFVEEKIALLREQMSQMYETVSLGLTAEALSHEINNIADQLGARNRKVAKHVQDKPIRDAIVVGHVEYIASTVSALRKQLSHLSPSLKYVREKRDSIKLDKFFKDVSEFYEARLTANDIVLKVEPKSAKAFEIKMNTGKVIQVIDNLLLNSEYWLKEDLRIEKIDEGIITIELERPFVRVFDNGRGFDKSVEASAFEPFVTMKGPGQGRGLGLFIVKQLLDSEGCKVELMSKRNKSGRKYIVEIDFTGALVSG